MASGQLENRRSEWKGRISKCLCCSCSTDSREPSPKFDMPSNPTQEDLENFLDEITQLCEDLKGEPSSNNMARLGSRWGLYKDGAKSFVDGLSKTEASTLVSRDLLLPLLSKAIGGVSRLHWVAAGLSLLAWSLEMVDSSSKNSEECLRLLRRAARLMKETKAIWSEAIKGNEIDEKLQNSIAQTSACAILCGYVIQKSCLWRCFFAGTVKDLLASASEDLGRVMEDLIFFVARDLQTQRPVIIEQQIKYSITDTVGADQVENEAMTILERDDDEIVGVCLQGMGGIGKTTVASNVFAKFQQAKTSQSQITYRFCNVELPLETKDDDLPKCQKRILDKLLERASPEFSNCKDGRMHLEKVLEAIKQPIFLFLDNILESSHLRELLPEARCFPKRSRILVTTRHEEVYGAMKVHLKVPDNCRLVRMKVLDEQAAKALLWKHVEQGERGKLNAALEKLEGQVLELCGGLPLALQVVGSYIAQVAAQRDQGRREAKIWKHVIELMKVAEPLTGGVNDRLYGPLKVSIDGLSPRVQKAFFDIVACAYYEPLQWDAAECLVELAGILETLHERALVAVEMKYDGRFVSRLFVRVHDVLKALGLQMAKQDKMEVRIVTQQDLDNIQELLWPH